MLPSSEQTRPHVSLRAARNDGAGGEGGKGLGWGGRVRGQGKLFNLGPGSEGSERVEWLKGYEMVGCQC